MKAHDVDSLSVSKGDGGIMWKRVAAYALLWNSKKHAGYIKLVLEDKSEHKIKVKSSSVFDALGNLLRHEKPINYNTKSGSLASGWEPLGDDELL